MSVDKWQQERSPDGWIWTDPHWAQRVEKSDALALTVEAPRRGIDLRDAAAESQEDAGLTQRALQLMAVLNTLFERVVIERADSLGISVQVPHGTGSEIVQQLLDLGLLQPDQYRSSS
jgi:hypothetical protein